MDLLGHWIASEVVKLDFVKLRQGSGKDGKDGKDGQGWARMALKAKGLKALNPCQELTLKLVATHPPPPPPTASLNTLH